IVYQELLTGQRPFNGVNVRQLIMQHLSASPNVQALPAADQRHVLRALSKKPDERFPSCRELVAELRAATPGVAAPAAPAGPSPAGTEPRPFVPPRPARPSWPHLGPPPPSLAAGDLLASPLTDPGSGQGATKCLHA